MADEQTQPSTQQVLDPRRIGRNNSGLNDKDIADVLAILHPASPSAIKVVEETIDRRPEHVLLRNTYDTFGDSISDIEEQETIIIERPHEKEKFSPRVGNDLALRMSSRLRDPSLGFVFGRNPHTADIVFGQDSGKRISNQHFRIFLNSDAILMLEDMSTNGTIVDEVLLRNKDARFNRVRMLASGSIICIANSNEEEIIKFIIRIPSRASHMDRFQSNLQAFFTKCVADEAKLNTLERLGKQRFGGPSMKWDGGDQYNIIGILGKGAFATVHQLATKMDGRLLAAKELEKRRFMKNGLLDRKIDNEMKIMQDLKHPNIVEFVEYHDQGDFLYIVMEYVRHGDLQIYLNQHGSMQESEVRLMAQQILSALGYLHRMKITHRDIKPDNILIADLNPLTVKLSDFGLSKAVKADETFLKTFCGTLLYCAPEVFPEFDDSLSKGTKRRRGGKQQYHSYSSSVDIWSFAAVVWYALCGKPPFEGIADATGRAMYTNIMNTKLDPTPLRQAQVSEACIDLLCKMLQKDPSLRPTEWQCLNHPWLNDGAVVADDPTLQSIVEEDESDDAEQQLSQLSLQEDFVADSDKEADDVLADQEFEMLVGARQPKKIRIDPLFPRNQPRDREHDSSADASFQSIHALRSGVDDKESFEPILQNVNRPRLFGEIGQSALQSSGILNVHANEALSHETSADALPDQNAQPAAAANRQITPNIRPPPQLDGAFSSPSLLGAESMVRDLNMASPASPGSAVQSENEPATPKTPDVPQHNSLEQHSQNASQFSEPTPKAKPPTFNRQISLPKTASFYFNPYDPSTHTLEYASKVSGFDFTAAAEATTAGAAEFADTIRQSAQDDSTDEANPSPTEDVAQPGPSPKGDDPKYVKERTEAAEPPLETLEVMLSLPLELDLKPPPRRLGKLIATPDSFAPGLTLIIERSRTSWGRLPTNTLVYENGRDTRVPKRAFLIFWWSTEGDMETVQSLSQHGKDWTSLPGINCGILTGATSGISINGKHLRQKDDKGRALYGHIHNGDIIQVYHDSKGSECLKFKCEIYLGSGKAPRPPGEAFNILPGSKLPV